MNRFLKKIDGKEGRLLDRDMPIAYLCQTRSTKLERINVLKSKGVVVNK